MSTRVDVKNRTNKIRRYLIRGLTPSEIAQVEGVSERAVYYYIERVKKLQDYDFKQLTSEELTKRIFENSKERIKELWNLYHSTNMDQVKICCLKALAKEDKRAIEIAQSLGMLHKEPERYEHTINLEQAKERLRSNLSILGRYGLLPGDAQQN